MAKPERLPTSSRFRAWCFVVPWVFGLSLFTLYPFAASLYYSFTDYSVLNPPIANGLENYLELAKDENFWHALKNTLVYALMAIPVGLLVALGLAKALHTPIRGTSFFRACIYIPHLVPTVASTVLWMWMLNPDQGLINALFRPFLVALAYADSLMPWTTGPVEPWNAPTFMSEERLLGLDFKNGQIVFGALPSLVLMSLWGVGQMVIIYLAKLQDVPQELYEAAEIDGGTGWDIFWHVELPQISPVILFNVIMGLIGAFQIFAEPFIMTGGTGGPNYATYLMPMFIYKNAFEFLRMGYACAAAWILFGIIALLTLVAFKIGHRRVYYAGR